MKNGMLEIGDCIRFERISPVNGLQTWFDKVLRVTGTKKKQAFTRVYRLKKEVLPNNSVKITSDGHARIKAFYDPT